MAVTFRVTYEAFIRDPEAYLKEMRKNDVLVVKEHNTNWRETGIPPKHFEVIKK